MGCGESETLGDDARRAKGKSGPRKGRQGAFASSERGRLVISWLPEGSRSSEFPSAAI